MGYKKKIKKIIFIFLIIVFQQNTTLANIVYDKDNILITELELEEFKKLYFQSKNIKLNKLKAIKELVLQKKTINQLENKQPSALKNIDKSKKDLFNFRFQKINSQITNPAKISETRKTIARLKTMLKGKLNA